MNDIQILVGFTQKDLKRGKHRYRVKIKDIHLNLDISFYKWLKYRLLGIKKEYFYFIDPELITEEIEIIGDGKLFPIYIGITSEAIYMKIMDKED